MKTIRYYIMSLALALTAIGCSDDVTTEAPKANPGDEVKFGASLPGTRTAYGQESDNAFPIYWKNGDLIKVASPQCNVKNAEYKVTVSEDGQNYANSLDKTGAAGIQWGASETADFYSIYPSTDNSSLNISGTNVTATLNIASTQTAKKGSVTDAEGNVVLQPEDMGNVVMYAKTMAAPSGQTVDLHYVPFSTVIEFEINGPASGQAGAATDMTVQSLTLTAPTGISIAGNFDLDLTNAPAAFVENNTLAATNVTNGSNSIVMHLLDENNAYVTIGQNKKIKAKLCLVPQPYTSLEGWTISIDCNAGRFTKTIKEYTVEEGKSKNLKAGMVHKVQLPPLDYVGEWTYELANWITSLPDYRNIYLTEISLPGAWYAGTPLVSGWGADENENYQTTESIEDLWKAGVRAFAVETKTVTPERTGFISHTYYENPIGVAISGTQRNGGSKSVGTNSLYPDVSGTDDVSCIQSSTKKIETLIAEIANQVKNDEFAVLVLSYADGGTSGLRYVDYGAWLQLLYDAYNGLATDVKNKIFSGVVTPNTTINDVLGKLILKINIDKNIAMSGWVGNYSYSYANNLPALFSYNPFVSQMTESDFSVPCFSDLYWQEWSDSESTHRKYSQLQDDMNATGKFMWVFSSANRTDCTGNANKNGVVTLAQRQNVLTQMMNYSKKIYDASTHNVWFYFNCGGTSTINTGGTGNAAEFAQNMNDWLLTKINEKIDASPLGIVMFNRCTDATYSGPAVIKAIIEMNSKFYLKHAGTNGGNTGGSTSGGSESGGTGGGGSGSETTNTAQNNATWSSGGNAF